MDIFSHALWAGLSSRLVNTRLKRKINVYWTALWGVFPDLFAFTIPFIWMIWNRIVNNVDFSQMMPKNVEPIVNHLPVFQLANSLYNISHSLIIFFLVFGIVWLLFRKPVWVMMGWLFHILIDIPTHSYAFYPTPIFWPLSNWKFNGISWGTLGFMIFDVTALIVFWIILKMVERKQRKKRSH